MRNKYTVTNCLALKTCLEADRAPVAYSPCFYLDEFDEILVDLRKTIQNIADCDSIVEKKLYGWIKGTYPKKEADKIIHFIFEESLEEAPLRINDSLLHLYAKWRLNISK